MEQRRDMRNAPTGIVNVNLRFDEALHQRLVAEARHSLRSLNSEVMFRLRESVERQSAEAES
jgi:predicted HicB family RNase H-like nuclease